jgi:hypothetical protein
MPCFAWRGQFPRAAHVGVLQLSHDTGDAVRKHRRNAGRQHVSAAPRFFREATPLENNLGRWAVVVRVPRGRVRQWPMLLAPCGASGVRLDAFMPIDGVAWFSCLPSVELAVVAARVVRSSCRASGFLSGILRLVPLGAAD